MFQTKLQDKTTERGLNEMEITNILDKDFKITVINKLTDLWKSTDNLRDDFNKEIEEWKKSHSELKNIVPERKDTMEGMNNGLLQVEETMNEMEI